MDTWSTGELAAQTGLTVRTLHHYDEIGLLAQLTPEQLEEMSARRRAARESMTPEQLEALHRSRPVISE